jgi:hypothetical protein
VKHVAWAAAISSSGLVLPSGSPKREATVTDNAVNAPLWADNRPAPLAIVPSQTTVLDLWIADISVTLLSGREAALAAARSLACHLQSWQRVEPRRHRTGAILRPQRMHVAFQAFDDEG